MVLLNRLLQQRANFWKQRSKLLWLKNGDVNNKFFHLYASARESKNYITNLVDEKVNQHSWGSGFLELIFEYFHSLF